MTLDEINKRYRLQSACNEFNMLARLHIARRSSIDAWLHMVSNICQKYNVTLCSESQVYYLYTRYIEQSNPFVPVEIE